MTVTIEPDAAAIALLINQWGYSVWKTHLVQVADGRPTGNIVRHALFDASSPPTQGGYILVTVPTEADNIDYGHYTARITKYPVYLEVHHLRSEAGMIAGRNELLRILDLARKNPALLNVGDSGTTYRKMWYSGRGQNISTKRVYKWIVKTRWEENLTGY